MSAYIFDLDGTLFDSMHIWEDIDREFLKRRNIEVPRDYIEKISGMNMPEVAKYTISRFSLNETEEAIQKEWQEMGQEFYSSHVTLKPYALEYLQEVKETGSKMAVATSLSSSLTSLALRHCGIYDLFDIICTTELVSKGKSHPDIFEFAAKELCTVPQDCIVFEDLYEAIISAKSIGMTVYGMYDKASENTWENIKRTADRYFYDFSPLLFLSRKSKQKELK